MRQLSLAIVGIDFANADKSKSNRRFELALCPPGEPVELRPEPKNKYDPYAIAVFSIRGVQVGYLTAERAPWIGGMINQGRVVTAIYQGLHGKAAWCRIAFDGEEPALPALSDKPPAAGDDFYPDDLGGDWGA